MRGMKTLWLLAAAVALAGCGNDSTDSLIASAKKYLAQHDPSAAAIQLKTALQNDPSSAEARFLLGTTLFEAGDPNSAEVELNKALEFGFAKDRVSVALAKVINAQGKYKDVTRRYGAVTLDDPLQNAELRTTVAGAYAELDDKSEAQRQLAAALASVPAYPPAQLMQARFLAADHKFDAALELTDTILAGNAELPEAWKFKGDMLYVYKGDTAGAAKAYRSALALRSGLIAAHTALLSTLMASKDVKAFEEQLAVFKKVAPGRADTKYYEALLASQKGDLKTAKALAQQLLVMAPESAKVLYLAGVVELQTGSLLQAENFGKKALHKAPGNLSALRLLGQVYLRSGQPAKVLDTLLPFVGLDGTDPELLAAVANAYLANGDIKESQAYFERAAKIDPKDVRTRTALALTRLASGSADAGFAELQVISAEDAGVTADLALISALFQRKELDATLKAVAKLESKTPNNPLAATLRGRVELARKNEPAARKSFEQAMKIAPDYFPAAAALANLDMAKKEPDAAKKRFEQVLAKDPKNIQALLALAQLRATTGGSKDEVSQLIQRAIELNPAEPAPRLLLIDRYIDSKEFKLAVSASQQALATLPDNPAIVEASGRAYQASGEFNQAIAMFTKWSEMLPQSQHPHLRLAEVYVALKQNDSAMQSLRRALDLAPDSLPAQRGLVALQLAAGHTREAIAIARSLQKHRPGDSIGFALEGEIEATQKNWDAAANAYRAGLQIKKSTGLAVKYHSVLVSSGKVADADKLAASWVKDNPADDVFLFYVAGSCLDRADYGGAETYYGKFVALRPDSPIALNNLAWLTAKLKKPGAIAYAERANMLMPNQAALMDTLAMLLADNNELKKALDLQRKAVSLKPEVASIRLNLAKLLLRSGDKSEARKELEHLARAGAGSPEYAEASQLIKQL